MTDLTLNRTWQFVPSLRRYIIPLLLVALLALFSFLSPYFLTVQNLTNILVQNSYMIIAAVGLSFVMISGGIDLSIGYQMSVVGIVTAVCMKWLNIPVAPSIVLGVGCGVLMGLVNGMASILLKVHSLIVTLGTLTIFRVSAISSPTSPRSSTCRLPSSLSARATSPIGCRSPSC